MSLKAETEKVLNMSAIEGLLFAKQIHEEWLSQRSSSVTGTHKWHRAWIALYDKALKQIGGVKSDIGVR